MTKDDLVSKDTALKMAIEALEMHVPHYIKDRGCEAIQACKEALEQPAQEDDLMTGTWIRYNDGDDTKRLALELDISINGIDGAAKSPALIDVLAQAVDYFKSGKKYHVLPIDDIEEHNESDSCKCNPLIETYELDKVIIHNSFDGRELNEHPAPSWQGLSDDEIWNIANFLGKNKEWDYPVMFAKTIEQALKEKNT